MRIARTLLLGCAAALAALALGATNASAAEAIEVDKEDGMGTNCNPCFVHAVGESEIHHPFFGEISDCVDEFEGEIYHQPADESPTELGHWGHITRWHGEPHAGTQDCTREMCDGAGGETADEVEWPITEMEEDSTNSGEMHVRFCLDAVSEEPEGAGSHCTAHVLWTDNNDHTGQISTNQQCPSAFGDVSVIGTWDFETVTHDAIDIVHANPDV